MNKTQREILNRCQKEGGRAWLSSTYFIEKLTVTYDTVMRNLKILVDKGFLEVKRNGVFNSDKKRRDAWVCWYRIKEEYAGTQQTLNKGADDECD